MASLRNSDHPYYATHGNFYSNECYNSASSWEEFMGDMGESDPDLNFLYRWDWQDQALSLFFVLQRKAIHMSYEVSVDSTDEPLIRAWLEERWKTVQAVWSPIGEESQP